MSPEPASSESAIGRRWEDRRGHDAGLPRSGRVRRRDQTPAIDPVRIPVR